VQGLKTLRGPQPTRAKLIYTMHIALPCGLLAVAHGPPAACAAHEEQLLSVDLSGGERPTTAPLCSSSLPPPLHQKYRSAASEDDSFPSCRSLHLLSTKKTNGDEDMKRRRPDAPLAPLPACASTLRVNVPPSTGSVAALLCQRRAAAAATTTTAATPGKNFTP
jgi:hypothetical protein